MTLTKEDVLRIHEEEIARNVRPGRAWNEQHDWLLARRRVLRDEALAAHVAATAAAAAAAADGDASSAKLHRERADAAAKKATTLTEQLAEGPLDEAELAKHAVMGTRTRLHAALREADPVPSALQPGEDNEDLSARQKAHDKRLWKRVEELVAEAGIGGVQ